MTQLGQYAPAKHVFAHISDTHFLAGGAPLFGAVQTETNLRRVLSQLENSGIRPEALVFTGDLADLGEPDAYRRLRAIVEPVAANLGAEVIWVMGNHDERLQYSHELFDIDGSEAPQDRVYDLGGLRIISLDTTVPGYHHGALREEQLDWLASVLATPAPDGTFIAVHHPPIPTPLLWAMEMLELHGQDALARVVRGTDVRGILGGHLHYSTHSTFAGIPVSVAAATCYTMNLTARDRLLSGVDGGQGLTMVHVYDEQVVHSIVPLTDAPEVTGFGADARAQIEAMSFDQRLEVFSKKNSPFNLGEIPAE
ncbi:MAG: 3,5-cyclic-AMP phosphodiesterase [Actinomycetota bacterium]|nr:3,5-cyclic-AMP phosphodiesterase [Actinomycetota bacterium]